MKKNVRDFLDAWQKVFIRDTDLAMLLNKSDDARYALVKRALKAGLLTRLRKGLYLITSKAKKSLPDEFELALHMYQPSIISMESALSYHGWIPEAVYITTCATPKRAQEFKTPLGVFSYKHVPAPGFYAGVSRIETATDVMLIADPWRALADLMYTKRISWSSVHNLEVDMRIDHHVILNSDQVLLKSLSQNYPSPRVCAGLTKLLQDLEKNKRILS